MNLKALKVLPKLKQQCVALAKQVRFAEFEEEETEELLDSHGAELSTDNLPQLFWRVQLLRRWCSGSDTLRACHFSSSSALQEIDKPLQWTMIIMLSAAGKSFVLPKVALSPHYELLHEKRRLAKQQKIDSYFKPQNPKEEKEEERNLLQSTAGFMFFCARSPIYIFILQ